MISLISVQYHFYLTLSTSFRYLFEYLIAKSF
nr:MAG TPA: hypothetical protein [Caudoviricetes sp.]